MNHNPNLVDLRLSGHTAVVTGGSRGIGRATCLALAAHGAAVGVHYSTGQAQAAEVVEEIRGGGGRAVAMGGDLREADAPGASLPRPRRPSAPSTSWSTTRDR
jgi:3-oxoacyl-[acyl-carrier protein] reductase